MTLQKKNDLRRFQNSSKCTKCVLKKIEVVFLLLQYVDVCFVCSYSVSIKCFKIAMIMEWVCSKNKQGSYFQVCLFLFKCSYFCFDNN